MRDDTRSADAPPARLCGASALVCAAAVRVREEGVREDEGEEEGGVCEEEERAAHPQRGAAPLAGLVGGDRPVGKEVQHEVAALPSYVQNKPTSGREYV